MASPKSLAKSGTGQAGIEALMTYGWVILVGVAGVVVLSQMGSYTKVPCDKTRTGFSQVVPMDWGVYRDTDVVVLKLESWVGRRINVTEIMILMDDELVCSNSEGILVDPGSSAIVIVNCSGAMNLSEKYLVDDCYLGEVLINYMNPPSLNVIKSKGKIRGVVEEGIAIPTTTSTTTSTSTTSPTVTTIPPVVEGCGCNASSVLQGEFVRLELNASNGSSLLDSGFFELNSAVNYSHSDNVSGRFWRDLDTSLLVGDYSLKCWVSDVSGNFAFLDDSSFTVRTTTTSTTTNPTTTSSTTSTLLPVVDDCGVNASVVVQGYPVRLDLNATNGTYPLDSGVFELNSSVNYSHSGSSAGNFWRDLDTSGLLGEYSLRCWVNDTGGSFDYLDDSSFTVVTTTTLPVDDSQYLSQSVPSVMVAGQVYPVDVAFVNNGTTTWTSAGNYRMGSQNPQDNTNWGLSRVQLEGGDSITPLSSKIFDFNVTAPVTPGSYNFQWRMLVEGVHWFGDYSPNVVVAVCFNGSESCSGASDCCSGNCKSDYDGGSYCALAGECVHDGVAYGEGASAPDCCDVSQRRYCSSGSWACASCGTDACTGTCGTGVNGCTWTDYYCSSGACGSTPYDVDTLQSRCDGCRGAGYWSLGGDVANCCGDDSSEYKKLEVFAGLVGDNNAWNNEYSLKDSDDSSISSHSSDACCDSDTDCVWNSVCYGGGGRVDTGYANNKRIMCFSPAAGVGAWLDCDGDTAYHCGRVADTCGYGMSADQYSGESTTHGGYSGGSGDGLECCGDDSSEYVRTRVCTSGCTSDSTDSRCCNSNTDCVYSGTCYASGACTGTLKCGSGSWTNHCANGVQDCDETGVDCGGSCPSCCAANGAACTVNGDCCSGYCKTDYDGSGGWCANADQCAHNAVVYNSGSNAPDCCDTTQRRYCNSGSWACASCGSDACSGTCGTGTNSCTWTDYYCSSGACGSTPYDVDTLQARCDGCRGAGYWSIGGEVDATECCGDDSGEYKRVETQSTDAPSQFDDGTDGCCNLNTDCVEGGSCYASAATYGAIPNKGYCNSGSWQGGDAGSTQCAAIVGSGYWNIGGEVSGTTCCGDDSGQYKKTRVCGSGSGCSSSSTDDACCNSNTDCVYSSTCYSSGSTYSGRLCSSGTWVGLADLVILDVGYGGTYNEIWFTVKNQGGSTAPSFWSRLYVDGSYKAQVSTTSIDPGVTRTVWVSRYTYKYSCSSSSDSIQVCADTNSDVAESNEGNNCRSETWGCPVCWSGYQYIETDSAQLRKFCKCVTGTYGGNPVQTWDCTRPPDTKTYYRYVDSGDNLNWGTTSATGNWCQAYRVWCPADSAYHNVNQVYYYHGQITT